MYEKEKDDHDKLVKEHESSTTGSSRRDFLKGSIPVAGAGLAAAAMPGLAAAPTSPSAAQDETSPSPRNPYGSSPGGGISLPDYYKPWPAIKNRNMYLPGTEILPKNEMRITFLGSSPWPPNPLQKGTSMLVELGNGTSQPRRFFFDLGNGSIGHAIASRRSFRRPPVHVSVQGFFRGIHALAGIRPVGSNAGTRNQTHGKAYEGDVPLARGKL